MDGPALVAKIEYSEQGKNDLPKHLGRDNQWKENKDNLWCTFCKKPKHTKEKCWKLNGKPLSREWGNRGGQQRPQAHMTEQPKTEENSTIDGFNSEENEKLRSLLGSLDKTTWTCSLALSGTPSLSFCINASHRVYDDSWIIDSGAIDHTTSKSQLFHTYTPNLSNKKIASDTGWFYITMGWHMRKVKRFKGLTMTIFHHWNLSLKRGLGEKRFIFCEGDICRDVKFFGLTLVSFLSGWVTKEDTFYGSGV